MNKNTNLLLISILLFSLCFTACHEKEDIIPESIFYISNQIAPVNKLDFDITYFEKQDSIDLKGATEYKFVVRSTMPVKNNTTIKCAINEDFVKKYNEQNEEEYLLLPNEYYNVVKDEVTIEAGAMESKDSIIFTLNTQADLKKLNKDYLLPIQIASINNKIENISTNMNTMKVFGNVYFVLDNIDPNNPIIEGTPINRNDWEIEASRPYYSDVAARYMLDGDVKTCWFTYNSSPYILLNMNQIHANIKGITLTPNTLYGLTYNPTGIEVLTSNNNKSWISQGRYYGDIPETGNINIKFKRPISAQHIKLNLIKNQGGSFTGVAELNVIK